MINYLLWCKLYIGKAYTETVALAFQASAAFKIKANKHAGRDASLHTFGVMNFGSYEALERITASATRDASATVYLKCIVPFNVDICSTGF